MQLYPKQTTTADAMPNQIKFSGIYCNSFILTNCTFSIIIPFWFPCVRGGEWRLIIADLRYYPIAWRNSFLRYKTFNLELLPKSVRSIVMHCRMNNIDSRSNEISLDVFTIARSISYCYSNAEVIVSELLSRDHHWCTRRAKINKTSAYLIDKRKIYLNFYLFKKIYQNTSWAKKTPIKLKLPYCLEKLLKVHYFRY